MRDFAAFYLITPDLLNYSSIKKATHTQSCSGRVDEVVSFLFATRVKMIEPEVAVVETLYTETAHLT